MLRGKLQRQERLMPLLNGLLLLVLVLLSLRVVGLSFESRELYGAIERAHQQQLELETLQGQLRIEHGTWVAPAEVEERARSEIGMVAPADTRYIRR